MLKSIIKSITINLALLLLLVGCDRQAPDEFSFVFMTDIHVQPERKATEGFLAAIDSVNELKPDFVITGGDLIMDALGVSYGRADSLYNIYQSTSTSFKMPLYQTIGNHELFAVYDTTDTYLDHPEYGKAMYKRRLGMGKTYYSFNHKGWYFFILDAIGITPDYHYYGHIDSLQMEWIREELVDVPPETPIAISTHIPFASIGQQMLAGGTKALGPNEVVANSNKVLTLFENHNLRLVLQGHLHIVEELIYNDTHFITGGAVSARWWLGPRYGFPEGFVVFDVKGNDFTWHYQTFGWEVELPLSTDNQH